MLLWIIYCISILLPAPQFTCYFLGSWSSDWPAAVGSNWANQSLSRLRRSLWISAVTSQKFYNQLIFLQRQNPQQELWVKRLCCWVKSDVEESTIFHFQYSEFIFRYDTEDKKNKKKKPPSAVKVGVEEPDGGFQFEISPETFLRHVGRREETTARPPLY